MRINPIEITGNWDKGIQLGTGELNLCESGVLKDLERGGAEVEFHRIVDLNEFASIKSNNGKFVEHECAMNIKWFATTEKDVRDWGIKLKHKEGEFRIIKITVLESMLKYMYHVKKLDGIGPAYAMDISMANKIVRRLKSYV